MPDKDLLIGQQTKTGISVIIGCILHHIIKQMDMYVARRKTDLLYKCPGAVIDDEYPKLIWIRMMKRPKNLNTKFDNLFAMRSKFNSILEERLLDGKAENHFIMSIEVDLNQFNISGGLTSSGMTHFWEEVNLGIKRFDEDEITLRPHRKAVQPEQSKEDNHPIQNS